MDKKVLRSKYLNLRNNINNRSEKEKKINNLLISLNISSKEKVSGYFPVRGEVNILPFIDFITDNKKRLLSTNIRFRLRVPRVDNLLSPLLLTIPLQLLAYHVALLKNCDIDKPRNLAKSVTVE